MSIYIFYFIHSENFQVLGFFKNKTAYSLSDNSNRKIRNTQKCFQIVGYIIRIFLCNCDTNQL